MVSSCTRTWGHHKKLTEARQRTNERKLVPLAALADLCKSSPPEGMAVTGSQGYWASSWKRMLPKSPFQRKPVSGGTELTPGSQSLHPSNGWWGTGRCIICNHPTLAPS